MLSCFGMWLVVPLLTFYGICAVVDSPQPTPPPRTLLKPLRFYPSTVTASGISAGAAFGVQFSTAYSALIRTNGIVAGIPYLCADGRLTGALMCMNEPVSIDLNRLLRQAYILQQRGAIDGLGNVSQQYIQLFSGTADTVVQHGTMLILHAMYKSWGVKSLVSYFDTPAEHAWITDSAGDSACAYLGSPYVNNCGLDFGGIHLKNSFAHLNLRWNNTRSPRIDRNLFAFSQAAFGADPTLNSMDTVGFVYIPTACQVDNATCHAHINFHGCLQSRTTLNIYYVLETGLNEWAESNNIVVVYPQAAPNALLDNPNGCFDWWGYLTKDYAVKGQGQMGIVRQILTGLGKI